MGFSLKPYGKNLGYAPGQLDLEDSLQELAFLTTSAGGEVVGRLVQEREKVDPAFFIGKGKLEELKEAQKLLKADVIVFDENLSPAQQRNIEKEVPCKIIDRTQLILDIFAHRARTRGQVRAGARRVLKAARTAERLRPSPAPGNPG